MNNNKSSKFLVVLSLIVFAFIGFYLFRYKQWQDTPIRDDFNGVDYDKDKDTTNNNDNNNPKVDNVSKIDDKKAKALYNKYRFSTIENYFGSEFKDIYYNNKDFSSEYMIYLAIVNLYTNDIQLTCHLKKEISANDLDLKIKELFGNHLYEKKSFTIGKLSVNYENDTYKIEVDNCNASSLNHNFIGCDYYTNREENGRLIITEIAYLVSIKEDGGLGYNYHQDVFESSKILGHDLNLIDKDSFSKYSYIFVNDGSNYYLEKIVKGE